MKISFVIPFHNEQNNVSPMLDQIIKTAEKHHLHFEIIPVNDKSTDQTAKIINLYAQKHSNIYPIHIRGRKNLGNTMGLALKAGTKKASGNIIIWTMGDLADDPQTYQLIINKIISGYDLVFGSRYIPGGSRGKLDPLKAFLSKNGTVLARILFQLPVHDITNAFRGFKKTVFNHLQLNADSFDISPELAIKAYLHGYKLAEVPTFYAVRKQDIPKFKLWKMTLIYLRIYWQIFVQQKKTRHA